MPAPPKVVWMPGNVRTEIHLTGEDTAGAFCLLRDTLPPGWALPPHRHPDAAETIHMIAGELGYSLRDGDEQLARAGETVYVPAGVRHATCNAGSGELRRLVTFSPAGMERFFMEAGAERPEESDLQEVLRAALRNGWEFG